MIRICVAGAAGRMGKTLIAECGTDRSLALGAAIEGTGSSSLGRDAGELAGCGSAGIPVTDDFAKTRDAFDVMIDFTNASAAMENVERCLAAGKRMVIGTTGFDTRQRATIEKAAQRIAIVAAPNMSIGVNLCFKLAELAARIIGGNSDIEILEAHHSLKRDAPSGTALRFGEIVSGAQGRKLEDCAVYARQGDTGPRAPGSIGFESIRAGDIVGDHTVLFASPGERVEITHRAADRRTFALGALRAAQWVMGKERGLYDMQDVLGLR